MRKRELKKFSSRPSCGCPRVIWSSCMIAEVRVSNSDIVEGAEILGYVYSFHHYIVRPMPQIRLSRKILIFQSSCDTRILGKAWDSLSCFTFCVVGHWESPLSRLRYKYLTPSMNHQTLGTYWYQRLCLAVSRLIVSHQSSCITVSEDSLNTRCPYTYFKSSRHVWLMGEFRVLRTRKRPIA